MPFLALLFVVLCTVVSVLELYWSRKYRFEEKIWICLVFELLCAVHGNSHLSPGGFETAVTFINGFKIIDERDDLHEEQSSAGTLAETCPHLSGAWGNITWKGAKVLLFWLFILHFHVPLFLLAEGAYKYSVSAVLPSRLLKSSHLVKSINLNCIRLNKCNKIPGLMLPVIRNYLSLLPWRDG